MKSISVSVGVVLIVGLLMLGYAEVWGADWRLFHTDLDSTFYYDTETITFPSKNIIRVWVKNVFTEQGVTNFLKEYGKTYKDLREEVSLLEINCEHSIGRFLSYVYYSNTGKVISSKNTPGEWKTSPPDSIGELMLKLLCKTTLEEKEI